MSIAIAIVILATSAAMIGSVVSSILMGQFIFAIIFAAMGLTSLLLCLRVIDLKEEIERVKQLRGGAWR